MSEHDEQVAFFDYVRLKAKDDKRYAAVFAVPNGGHRHKTVAGKLKAEGVEAGVPDLFVAVPTAKYPGLFIEMKYGRNKLSDNQKGWIALLSNMGYVCSICWSAEDAIEVLEMYLSDTVQQSDGFAQTESQSSDTLHGSSHC